MPAKKKANVRKRAPLRRRAVTRVGKPSIRNSVVSYVKGYVQRAIAAKAENKVVNVQSSVSLCSYANDNTCRAIALTPNSTYSITQGITQNTRVGNSITVKRIMFNYTITTRPYDAITNSVPRPGLIQMILCRVKNSPSDIPNNGDVNNLFQNGSAAASPLGTIEDLNRYFNKDYFQILKSWSHKLGCASYTGTGSTAPATAQLQYYANNDFEFFIQRKMDISKYIPKTMKFNDNTGAQTGAGIFLLTQYLNADGTSHTQISADLKFYINFEFEDS